MKTRDKDFTGCHPEIAEALKNLKDVLCYVWDADMKNGLGGKDAIDTEYVTDYYAGIKHPYITFNKNSYTNAEPVKTKKIVKPFYELIEQLKKEGYCAKRDPKGGFYLSNSNEPPGYYTMSMLCDCGRDEEESMFAWPEKDLMEVEE